jgi:uncharacterized protein YndB with AHSA1/START domain
MTSPDVFDPKLDLELTRTVDVPPALVWKAWTQPQHLMPWFRSRGRRWRATSTCGPAASSAR